MWSCIIWSSISQTSLANSSPSYSNVTSTLPTYTLIVSVLSISQVLSYFQFFHSIFFKQNTLLLTFTWKKIVSFFLYLIVIHCVSVSPKEGHVYSCVLPGTLQLTYESASLEKKKSTFSVPKYLGQSEFSVLNHILQTWLIFLFGLGRSFCSD